MFRISPGKRLTKEREGEEIEDAEVERRRSSFKVAMLVVRYSLFVVRYSLLMFEVD